MGTWSRAELEDAFAHYLRAVEKAVATGDWEHFVQCFTIDAEYVEHAYGTFHGHDEIRRWITRTMGTFPGNAMVDFPPSWSAIDEERGWVVCEIRNVMADPGDGSAAYATNLTILRYAGDNRWAGEEDVYNPAHFLTLTSDWLAASAQHGTLSDEARTWAERMRIPLG